MLFCLFHFWLKITTSNSNKSDRIKLSNDTIIPYPKIINYTMNRGSEEGGTYIVLHVSPHVPKNLYHVYCRFGYIQIRAWNYTEQYVTCRSPPFYPGQTILQVSFNNKNWSDEVQFYYIKNYSINKQFHKFRSLMIAILILIPLIGVFKWKALSKSKEKILEHNEESIPLIERPL
ncbi:hypothetical protein TRFO_16057 [Tritrichomonas foetus]|uniref:Uncharacterized protein n=1 Tax=Tritrichomonas foetus TaxID=1144522 RepID=A0A1J4KW43_9EUKA|nr:hypothetical protein TRFO_16057 [Tritrichomonas foetus]|eukprot:OHT13733.1 hypothetical protein TRFO_16057 [Tritrichomonas foetus]